MEKKIKDWETLSTQYICKRPWLTARRDKVKLPSGVVNDEFYILEYPAWINVIARTQDGLFVIERQFRQGLQQVCTEICAGVVEQGETPLEAARRELEEETGLGGGTWRQLLVQAPNASSQTNLCYSFVAEGVVPICERHLEPTEDIAIDFVSAEELARMLREGEIPQSTMLSALWKYFAEKHLI